MRILVVSDTHGSLAKVQKILRQQGDKISTLLHLGDHSQDAKIIKESFPNLEVHFVKGNCDMNPKDPREKVVEIQGKILYLCHGDQYDVKWSYTRLAYKGEEVGADIVLCGHTHIPTLFYHGEMIVMNPGSISLPRQSKIPTYGVIEITEEGMIIPSIVQYAIK